MAQVAGEAVSLLTKNPVVVGRYVMDVGRDSEAHFLVCEAWFGAGRSVECVRVGRKYSRHLIVRNVGK